MLGGSSAGHSAHVGQKIPQRESVLAFYYSLLLSLMFVSGHWTQCICSQKPITEMEVFQ